MSDHTPRLWVVTADTPDWCMFMRGDVVEVHRGSDWGSGALHQMRTSAPGVVDARKPGAMVPRWLPVPADQLEEVPSE